jgi:hypothetical protein
MRRKSLSGLLLMMVLVGGIGCSVGRLLVRVPTPTPEPTKTPRPTFTFTPNWTPTALPTFTFTFTPVLPTDTPTPEATPTPEEATAEAEPPTDTPPPPPTNTPVPQPPPDTPMPEPPTATPMPSYPFVCTLFTHPTGNQQFTYITASAYKWIDKSMGNARPQAGYVLTVISPAGEEKSEVSGPGYTDSRGPGLGDNHWMNMKVEFAPYVSGDYRAYLTKDGTQVSNEVQFTMSSGPLTYAHLECISE